MLRPNQNPPELAALVNDGGFNWPESHSPSPSRSPSRPLLANHSQRSLSQNSRIQAIVRGQRELMEMVKNMPESSYELSLKDLVENQAAAAPPAPPAPPPPQEDDKFGSGNNSDNLRGGKMKREGSQKGVFLKMGFPISLRKRRNDGAGKGASIGEKDWWKKKFSGSGDSDSSRASNTSGSTRSSSSSSSSSSSYGSERKKNGFLSSCLPFLQSRSKYS